MTDSPSVATLPLRDMAAAKLVLQHGYATNSAGGSQHAVADRGAGFCVFDGLAIAATKLIKVGDISRVLRGGSGKLHSGISGLSA